MAPMDPEDAKRYHGSGGRFFNTKDLKPGESTVVQLQSIDKHYKTQFPIKDKDYCYRVLFKDDKGEERIMDMNGADMIRQFAVCLYPAGPEGPMKPCTVRLSRRTERRKTQSELMVELVESA